jgi:non-ribosomal peptide synthetase component F
MAADSTARNVAQRVDALAAALRAAGVPPEQSAGLLAAAATAAMSAVMLDALLEENLAAAAPVPVTEVRPVEQPIRLAA